MSVNRDATAIAANDQAVPLAEVPVLAPDEFRALCLDRCAHGLRIASLSALPDTAPGTVESAEVLAILADDPNSRLELARMKIPGNRHLSIPWGNC